MGQLVNFVQIFFNWDIKAAKISVYLIQFFLGLT